MMHSEYTAEEVVRRGEEIYERELRPKVEAEHRGKFLVLDVVTGAYEIDADDLAASDRLLARKPDAKLYGLRIGYPTAYRLRLQTGIDRMDRMGFERRPTVECRGS